MQMETELANIPLGSNGYNIEMLGKWVEKFGWCRVKELANQYHLDTADLKDSNSPLILSMLKMYPPEKYPEKWF